MRCAVQTDEGCSRTMSEAKAQAPSGMPAAAVVNYPERFGTKHPVELGTGLTRAEALRAFGMQDGT